MYTGWQVYLYHDFSIKTASLRPRQLSNGIVQLSCAFCFKQNFGTGYFFFNRCMKNKRMKVLEKIITRTPCFLHQSAFRRNYILTTMPIIPSQNEVLEGLGSVSYVRMFTFCHHSGGLIYYLISI